MSFSACSDDDDGAVIGDDAGGGGVDGADADGGADEVTVRVFVLLDQLSDVVTYTFCDPIDSAGDVAVTLDDDLPDGETRVDPK
jgi:hypothetical protein